MLYIFRKKPNFISVSNLRVPKLESVQFCRAIAFLMVLMLHRTPSWDYFFIFQHGNYGVMLFFIISGFIITFLHLNDKIESPQSFLLKRFIRLYPIYFFVTLLCLGTTYYNYKTNFTGFSALTKINDIGWTTTLTLLPVKDKNVLNNVAWSLIYEIWYYLIFAFLIFKLRNKFILGICAYAYIIFIVQLFYPEIASLNFIRIDFNIIFSTLNWFFIMGACIAYLAFEDKPKHSLVCITTFIFCYFAQIFIGFENQYAAKGGRMAEFLLLTLSLFIFISTLLLEKKQIIKFPKFLILIGNASYFLYLFHYLWVEWLRAIFNKLAPNLYPDSTLEKSVYYISLLLICLAAYKYVELPLNKYLRHKLMAKKQN